jgi:hypothetical protein
MKLYEKLKNPLTRSRDNRDRELLLSLFSPLRELEHSQYLCLRPYLRSCPERFFDFTAYECFFKFLKNRDAVCRDALKNYLKKSEVQIEGALIFLRQINSENWHDKLPDTGDEYDLLRLIDRSIHPAYLRLVEAVLAPLARTVAYFSRIDRGAGTNGLGIWSVIHELSGGSFSVLVEPYRHIVRNGIAHGGITYLQNKIRYRDKKGNSETLSTSAAVRLCDDLLDTCNGLAAALKVFLIFRRECGYGVPQELLLEELQEETRTPWWKIEGCISTEIPIGRQLIVYAWANSGDPAKVRFSAIQSGLLAEYLAPGYDRYFFSINSPKALKGFTAFDGKKLQEHRIKGTNSFEKYQGVIENNPIFYVPNWPIPHIFRKLDTLQQSVRLNLPIVLEQHREKLGIPTVVTRDAAIHRNSWGCVLNGSVHIDFEEKPGGSIQEMIRKWRRRIVKNALHHARANAGRLGTVSHLPLGFVRLRVFRKDYRCRRLCNFGLGQDLICTIQFHRIRRIQSPDIIGSTVEKKGKWRIAWNRAWLENLGQRIRIDRESEATHDLIL